MEDNIQTIIIYLIAAILLFIFPVYTAYEKKDDISYALALKYTQEFTNEVAQKGYLSRRDYDSFIAKLNTTGNMYAVQLEHEYSSIIPVVNYYDFGTDELIKSVSLDYYENDIEGKLAPLPLYKIDITHRNAKEIFGEEHILNIINEVKGVDALGNDIYYDYYMNEGDQFKVIVKNTNVTFATLMYNMIVSTPNNTRIYVNCSGQVTATKWYSHDIDYNITDISGDYIGNPANQKKLLYRELPLVEENNTDFTTDKSLISNAYKDFTIKFILYPIKTDGIDIYSIGKQDNGANSNYLIDSSSSTTRNRLAISVGVNGIMVDLVYNESGSKKRMCILTYKGIVNQRMEVEICVKNNDFALFVNGERVSHSELSQLDLSSTIINRGIVFDSGTILKGSFESKDTSETYFELYPTIE